MAACGRGVIMADTADSGVVPAGRRTEPHRADSDSEGPETDGVLLLSPRVGCMCVTDGIRFGFEDVL